MRHVRVATGDGPVDGTIDADGVVRTAAGAGLGDVDDLRLLPPCSPTKIIGVGRNYASHLAQQGRTAPTEPWVFLATPNALAAHGDDVEVPTGAGGVDFEGELALVIGRRASGVTASRWRDHVLGITNANDLTVRSWQEGGAQWWRAKSSDGLKPLGPWVETDVDLDAPQPVRAWVDGELRQDGGTDDVVFGFGELLEFITRTVTLEPGDVVLTGSPGGAGPVAPGQTVEIEVAGIGRLRNRIVEAR